MDREFGFSDMKEALPKDIQELIHDAHERMFSFVPNAWRPSSGKSSLVKSNELFIHRLSIPSRTFPNLSNYQVAKKCIEKAIEQHLYQEAVDIIFILDRYAYWMDNSETPELLDKIQKIVDRCPEVAVAPQLIRRKVRWLTDRGGYQSADQICSSVLSQAASCVDHEDLVIGTWSFRSRGEFLHTVTAFLLLKGMIQMYLAQPVDAAVYLAASCQLAHDIETRDERVIAHCLQVFTDVFLDMACSEREELQSVVMVNNSELPLMKYLTKNGHILRKLPPGDVHFLKQIRKTRIELPQLRESIEPPETDIPRTLLHHLKSGIPENLEWAILQYQVIARDYAASVFDIHLAFEYFGHSIESTKDIMLLSQRLFMKSCGINLEEDILYFHQELAKIRVRISNLSGSLDNDETQNPAHESRYPVLRLRGSLPIDLLRDFKNPAMIPKYFNSSPLTKSTAWEPCETAVDPVSTTFVRNGMLSSDMQTFQPKLFRSDDSHHSDDAISVEVEKSEGIAHRSLVKLPTIVVDGFSAPQKLLDARIEEKGTAARSNGEGAGTDIAVSGATTSRVLQTQLTRSTVYRANVARYYSSEDQWRYHKTLVFIHEELQLTKKKRGQLRDVIKLQYLHQGDFKAMHIGKLYRGRTLPRTYHNDVILHQLALQCVSRFNKRLQNFPKFANRIRMVPVVHMEIFDENDYILEVLNVEPFIHGNFTKMTNNMDAVNSRIDSQLLLAFSHFTWCDSDGKFMVTDLQGWIPDDPRVSIILTDPAINSERLNCLGLTNMGSEGFKAFWMKQHPTCNEICQLLKLERDSVM